MTLAAVLGSLSALPSCCSAPAASVEHPAEARSCRSACSGIPSLHSIIQAIATGSSARSRSARAGWLKHGTVATIQHLVALPDPAAWPHVGALQGDMTYLGAMLLPVTLAVGAVRYWLVGLTGAAHPASAVTRSVGGRPGVLVAYRLDRRADGRRDEHAHPRHARTARGRRRAAADHRRPVRRRAAERRRRRVRRAARDRRRRVRRRAVRGAGADDACCSRC